MKSLSAARFAVMFLVAAATRSAMATPPSISGGSATLVMENCFPTNGAIDPGETVIVSFELFNSSAHTISNLVATMQTNGSVSGVSKPQTYGTLAPTSSVSRTFTFTASGDCGGFITNVLQISDSQTISGTVTFVLPLGVPVTSFTENFDRATAPALPAGWTTACSGAMTNWVTTTNIADTATNDAFVTDANGIGVGELVSPLILITSGSAELSFRNWYDLEIGSGTDAYDGGVLEIKIGTNSFADISAVGGVFITNGYNSVIDLYWGNPLVGRSAWSGSSGGYQTSIVKLPGLAAGQSVQFRWRCGTDFANDVAVQGWHIDSVTVNDRVCSTSVPMGIVLLATNPANGGAVSGGGAVPPGTNMVLSATPANGHWFFTSWNDGDTNATRTISVPASISTYTANFTQYIGALIFYVKTNGDDSADGLSWATAKQTIQAAVDLAISNDMVIVSNGAYATGSTKTPDGWQSRVGITNAITVQSVNGPANTFIVGQGPVGPNAVRCAYLADGGTLSGFTLTNGCTSGNYYKTDSGGGVFCNSARGVVSNCVLSGNSAYNGGGSCYGTLNNCTLSGNSAPNNGNGGGSCYSTLNNCVLSGNSAFGGDGWGGGSYYGTLNNCTLSENYGDDGGGSFCDTLNNCIVYFNNDAGRGTANYAASAFNYSCTTPVPGMAGNIASDPQFVDAANGDFHLKAVSPCIDAGSNSYATNMTTDLDGNPRIMNGTVDMGTYETLPIVTVMTNPATGGTVSGGGSYLPGTNVVLTATPNAFWLFTGWSDGSTNLTDTITMPATNITFTANFAMQMATVSVLTNPANGGTASGGGAYQVNSNVVLAAAPNLYWLFTSWSDGDTNATRTISVPSSNIAFTANFAQQHAMIIVQTNGARGGTVAGGGDCFAGSNAVITATPNRNWRFIGWNDGCQDCTRSVFVSVTGGTYTAFFQAIAPPDFENDGKADIAVFWPGGGAWNVLNSSGGSTNYQLGYSADLAVAADYDGDGKADFALFEPPTGNWFINLSSNGNFIVKNWGYYKSVPVPADYDGDGKADIAVYDPPTGNWYILQSSNSQMRAMQWGSSNAIPVPADYDGDGRADIATYVPASGMWSILQSSDGKLRRVQWGWSQALPVPADYDGDGKADIATYYPDLGMWNVLRSTDGSLMQQQWGFQPDVPVPADYDGDGQADISVYRPDNGMWYTINSGGSTTWKNWGWTEAAPVMPQVQINRHWFPSP